VKKHLGVKDDEPYVVLRFISWEASHDKGHSGISLQNKIKAVREFSKYSKVFISSEKSLPTELEPNKIPISPEKIHHALYYSKMFWGESATMATEAVVLGTPAVYLDNTGRYYTDELENKYDLVYNFLESEVDQKRAIEKGVEILSDEESTEKYGENQKKLLDDKIDVTEFLVWFVEDYPRSREILRDNSYGPNGST